jgi:hypothetical protein
VRVPVALALTVAGAAAGGGGRSGPAAAPGGTPLFGDDRATQGDSARAVPDVALLERLIDEYEGLDVAMDRLAGLASQSTVRGKAWSGDRHEDASKASLLDVLQREYGEHYVPRTPAGAARTADSIGTLPRDAGTRALKDLVLRHHRRVAQTIGDALPSVRNSRVRDVLVDLHEHLRKEIDELSAGRPAS